MTDQTNACPRNLSETGMVRLIQREVQARGSQQAVAKWARVSPQFLTDVLHGRRKAGPRLAVAFGYKPIAGYVRTFLMADQTNAERLATLLREAAEWDEHNTFETRKNPEEWHGLVRLLREAAEALTAARSDGLMQGRLSGDVLVAEMRLRHERELATARQEALEEAARIAEQNSVVELGSWMVGPRELATIIRAAKEQKR